MPISTTRTTKRSTSKRSTASGRTTAGRVTATALAAALAAVVAAPSPAAAADGFGSASVGSTILDLKLGNLLGIQVLEDAARSSSDARTAAPIATSALTQLRVSSGVVPALNIATPRFEATTAPGGVSKVSTALLDLGSVAPPAVASGAIQPIALSALLQPTTASSMEARIANITLGSALAKLGVVQSVERTGSGVAAAEGTRNISIDALSVLDLGSLLTGLGIDILSLPLSVVSELVATLGLSELVSVPTGTTLAAQIDGLRTSIDTLLAATETTVTTPLADTLGALLPGPLAPVAPAAGEVVSTVITTLRTTLATLLTTALDVLSKAVLVQVTALELGTVARAGETKAASAATAVGKIGAVKVGAITIPGLDVAATADQLNALLTTVNGTLGSALAPLGLGNLLSVKLFDRSTSVTDVDGVVKASAAITGLSVKVTPPPLLAGAVESLLGTGTPVGSLLGTSAPAGAASPGQARSAAVTDGIADLQALVGGQGVLAQGVSLDVARVTSAAEHLTAAAVNVPGDITTGQQPTGSLPRTGGEDILLGGLAAFGVAGGLGMRHLRRRAQRSA